MNFRTWGWRARLALTAASMGMLACGITPTLTATPADLLTGMWREEAQTLCDTGQEIAPVYPIGELIFKDGYQFKVTWVAFEGYVDYWGKYTYDPQTGALTLVTDSGNHIPKDLDPSGTATIDAQGKLVLRDMWLGVREIRGRYTAPPGQVCSQRFFRR